MAFRRKASERNREAAERTGGAQADTAEGLCGGEAAKSSERYGYAALEVSGLMVRCGGRWLVLLYAALCATRQLLQMWGYRTIVVVAAACCQATAGTAADASQTCSESSVGSCGACDGGGRVGFGLPSRGHCRAAGHLRASLRAAFFSSGFLPNLVDVALSFTISLLAPFSTYYCSILI